MNSISYWVMTDFYFTGSESILLRSDAFSYRNFIFDFINSHFPVLKRFKKSLLKYLHLLTT